MSVLLNTLSGWVFPNLETKYFLKNQTVCDGITWAVKVTLIQPCVGFPHLNKQSLFCLSSGSCYYSRSGKTQSGFVSICSLLAVTLFCTLFYTLYFYFILCKKLFLLSVCLGRNQDSSDQATFFQSLFV